MAVSIVIFIGWYSDKSVRFVNYKKNRVRKIKKAIPELHQKNAFTGVFFDFGDGW